MIDFAFGKHLRLWWMTAEPLIEEPPARVFEPHPPHISAGQLAPGRLRTGPVDIDAERTR